MKKNIGPISALAAVILEVLFFKVLAVYTTKYILAAISLLFTIVLVAVVIRLIHKRKNKDFLLSFLTAVHNHAPNIFGVFLIVFVLVQIDLIGASFHEYLVKGDGGWETLILVDLMFLPFVLHAHFPVEKLKDKVPEHERKVLVTALSLNDKSMAGFKEKNYSIAAVPHNWRPVFEMLKKYERIELIVFLLSNEVSKQIHAINAEIRQDVLKKILAEEFPQREKLRFEQLYITNIDDFDDMYKRVKPAIEGSIAGYKSEEIIFGITSGPSTITATLVFLSMPGKRGFVYLKQNDPKDLAEFNIHAYDVKELWDEIFETHVNE